MKVNKLKAFKIVLLFLILASFVSFGLLIPLLKNKFASAATYKPQEETAFVDFGTIVENIKGEEITIIQPSKKAILKGAKWIPQSFNNCGPATTSMVLQYFGYSVDQNTTKAALRTNPDDKNVFTYEMAEYLKGYGIESKLLYNGDYKTLKTLIANGFYVVVEDMLHPNEDIGHVTIIRGFDDTQEVFIADDSYLGVNIVYKYSDFDETQWKAFNREYLPVYTADKEPLLKAIIGENWNSEAMYNNAIKRNQADVDANQNDKFAWFNLGTSFYALGEYQKAADAFDKSQSLGWSKRMLWYQIQPIQAANKLGNYQKSIELANFALGGNETFAEAHLEKAKAYKGLNDLVSAQAEIQAALNYSPNLTEAKDLLNSL